MNNKQNELSSQILFTVEELAQILRKTRQLSECFDLFIRRTGKSLNKAKKGQERQSKRVSQEKNSDYSVSIGDKERKGFYSLINNLKKVSKKGVSSISGLKSLVPQLILQIKNNGNELLLKDQIDDLKKQLKKIKEKVKEKKEENFELKVNCSVDKRLKEEFGRVLNSSKNMELMSREPCNCSEKYQDKIDSMAERVNKLNNHNAMLVNENMQLNNQLSNVNSRIEFLSLHFKDLSQEYIELYRNSQNIARKYVKTLTDNKMFFREIQLQQSKLRQKQIDIPKKKGFIEISETWNEVSRKMIKNQESSFDLKYSTLSNRESKLFNNKKKQDEYDPEPSWKKASEKQFENFLRLSKRQSKSKMVLSKSQQKNKEKSLSKNSLHMISFGEKELKDLVNRKTGRQMSKDHDQFIERALTSARDNNTDD